MAAATRNRAKINSPKMMFGRNETMSLTILAVVLHAIEKLTCIRPPEK